MTRHDNDQPEAAESASSPAISPEQNENERRIRSYERKLRRLSSELALTEARERRAIASDLHDHIGQALAYAKVKLTRLQGNSVFCGFDDDFSELLELLDQTIRYTRDLTVEISPPALYELGLVPAIRWLAERAERKHEFKVKTKEKGRPLKLSDEVQILMFKSLQELLANVAKHARATRVTIHVDWQSDGLQIRVVDNGQGFAPGAAETRVSAGDGFGLFSIRERLSYAGGNLVIDSTPDTGTEVIISAPSTILRQPDEDQTASR